MIVLDANILIRAVLGTRVRSLIEHYGDKGVRFLAPCIAFEDAEKYLPELLRRRGKDDNDVLAATSYLRELIEPVDRDVYGEFERESKERLHGRDETDWPVLAVALAFSCPVWTEDADFFGTGVAVWTTNRIEIFLKAQLGNENE